MKNVMSLKRILTSIDYCEQQNNYKSYNRTHWLFFVKIIPWLNELSYNCSEKWWRHEWLTFWKIVYKPSFRWIKVNTNILCLRDWTDTTQSLFAQSLLALFFFSLLDHIVIIILMIIFGNKKEASLKKR